MNPMDPSKADPKDPKDRTMDPKEPGPGGLEEPDGPE